MTEYRWKPNVPSMWTKLDAQAIGSEIERLEEEHQHSLTPEEIVRAAESKRSPLHPAFEWNDEKAANHYRIDQARKLISLIDVVFVKADQSEVQVRAFVSVEAPGGRGYTQTVHALDDPDLRNQIVQRAWVELDAWKQRYAELSELGKLFSAIDKARPHPKGQKPPK